MRRSRVDHRIVAGLIRRKGPRGRHREGSRGPRRVARQACGRLLGGHSLIPRLRDARPAGGESGDRVNGGIRVGARSSITGRQQPIRRARGGRRARAESSVAVRQQPAAGNRRRGGRRVRARHSTARQQPAWGRGEDMRGRPTHSMAPPLPTQPQGHTSRRGLSWHRGRRGETAGALGSSTARQRPA